MNHASSTVHQVLPEDGEEVFDGRVDHTVGRVLGGSGVDGAPVDHAGGFGQLHTVRLEFFIEFHIHDLPM